MSGSELSRRSFLGTVALAGATLTARGRGVSAAESSEAVALDAPTSLDALPTPALIVDVAAMERNLQRMAEHARVQGLALRPHTKTHKCPILAKKQLELGAVGVCAAKVGEAEVMVDAGVEAVLITSPVVTREKIAKVVALAAKSDKLQIVVDHAMPARRLSEAAEAAGVTVGVLVDLDPGIGRTGIQPGEPAVRLVQEVLRLPGLRFDGLQAYAGHVMHVDGWEERRKRSREALERSLETKTLLEGLGYDIAIFTGGGTGTFDIDPELEQFTDLQVGSYLFMDLEYRAVGDRDGDVFNAFEPSLFVWSTAISQPLPDRITIDAGFKAFATDSVKPELRDVRGVVYHWGGDEHGILDTREASHDITLGNKMALHVPHCDPTVNLYDFLAPYRDEQVAELWPIAARGRSQ
ncbi:MAG: DSD1 family PLP-dependent enzyme [Thermoanaerobaculia bacterium]|nr:DSD1 family PLP-dependent enzyme [Thermoanaerobaculia bacterium]